MLTQLFSSQIVADQVWATQLQVFLGVSLHLCVVHIRFMLVSEHTTALAKRAENPFASWPMLTMSNPFTCHLSMLMSVATVCVFLPELLWLRNSAGSVGRSSLHSSALALQRFDFGSRRRPTRRRLVEKQRFASFLSGGREVGPPPA